MIGGVVGSPLPASATDKMTDRQWLQALARYTSETDGRDHGFSLIGGAHQLSGVLEHKVTQEPERYAELMLRFPESFHSDYFDAVLRGIGKVNEEVEIALKVCRRCHQLPGRPLGGWICDPVRKIVEKPLPDELLELVGWYATEATEGTENHSSDLEFIGLNSTRGRAALAMADTHLC